MYKAQCVSILELTKLIGLLLLTVQAMFPAKIQFRYPQQLQIQTFEQNYLYQQITIPHAKCKQELKWWIKHFELSNGKRLKQFPPQIIIQTDASLTGWEEGGGVGSLPEQNDKWNLVCQKAEMAQQFFWSY